jgi:crossover junction endodeoxyribonuclease RuvC
LKVLAIDPGLERMGYAIVERSGSQLRALDYGLIETPRIALSHRLKLIHDRCAELLANHRPDGLAIERLLFTVNKTTAMDVAKAIGVVLLAASEVDLLAEEISPPEVKQAVVGHGQADKKQVQYMVTKLLNLSEPPRPDDVADALAIGIAYALRYPVERLKVFPSG